MLKCQARTLHCLVRAYIAVVDDEPMIRSLVAKAMKRRGWRVIAAEDVLTALHAVAHRKIDLVLADIIMPGGSGPELAEALQATAPDLPVLFMSGHPERSQFPLTPLPCWGSVPEVLAKPFELRELTEKLAVLFGSGSSPNRDQHAVAMNQSR